MHYYPYPFKNAAEHVSGADDQIDRLIPLIVGFLCLAMVWAAVWP
ncbi:hypothetical protein [Azospirillum sp. TSO22-1]|nr:hypothetical protein [Azospirillum sp. TSO22-1]